MKKGKGKVKMNNKKHDAICKNFPYMIHGGDYNPDQWLEFPEIINEDMRLIPLAHCNAMSINIFAWATLEPEEDKYDFSYLDDIMDRLDKIGAKAILATPSGARPGWMSKNHPEVLRVDETRHRNLHGARHNHCYTSPCMFVNHLLSLRLVQRSLQEIGSIVNAIYNITYVPDPCSPQTIIRTHRKFQIIQWCLHKFLPQINREAESLPVLSVDVVKLPEISPSLFHIRLLLPHALDLTAKYAMRFCGSLSYG